MKMNLSAQADKQVRRGVGVWIDSRKALIVAETDGAAGATVIRQITTNLEKQLRLSSGERAKTTYGLQNAPADDMRETSSNENMKSFFDDVVAVVREAHSIFIFGPGEAKEEFKKRLEQDGLGGLIDEVAVVGRMSDRQIAAKVHDHFRPRV